MTPDAAAFAESVRDGLTGAPRMLDPKYFYDDLGSALFDAICRLPWYPITRAELAMLAEHAGRIFDAIPGRVRVVELGCGSGEKLLALLEPCRSRVAGVHLVDISEAALEASRRRLDLAGFNEVTSHRGPYEDGLEAMRAAAGHADRLLVLFLGSNIGNFETATARRFLGAVARSLRPGDALLLGTDLVKPEPELVAAYDDPLGVTAAFNRNLLARINRELGGNFHLPAWQHRACWNANASRVEMHLEAIGDQRVTIPSLGLDMFFAAGERIWTESSYKYEPDQVRGMLEEARFRVAGQWVHAEAAFALTAGARLT